jgi:hypothetical protein
MQEVAQLLANFCVVLSVESLQELVGFFEEKLL